MFSVCCFRQSRCVALGFLNGVLNDQISKKGKGDQSKHTPRRGNKNPYKNKFNQTRIIYTGNRTEFKSHNIYIYIYCNNVGCHYLTSWVCGKPYAI